jgi:hypothetical protein
VKKQHHRQKAKPAEEDDLNNPEVFTRHKCTRLEFWRMCGRKPCKRHKACHGDAKACWDRHWAILPEEFKEYLRLAIKFRAADMSAEEADRAATAEMARIAERLRRL